MSDIFISYARDDLAKARMLADALAGEGWSVWWDAGITPGEEWGHVIEQELSRARCVIVLWSNVAVTKYWVREEARDGLDRKILIQALLDNTHLPFGFRGIQAISLANWEGARLHQGLQHLLQSVGGLLGGRPSGAAALQAMDLRPSRRKTAAVGTELLERVAHGMEFDGQHLGTAFSVGRSSLLVSDANVYNAAIHWSRGDLRPRHGKSRISARPMAGQGRHEATLVLPPDRAQDLALFDTTPWAAPAAITLNRDAAPVKGEDVLCVVALGESRGIHTGTITGVDEATDIAGMPSGPALIDRLVFTDIVTSGGSAGAPLLRRNGTLVGVVVAGDDKRSIAIPAARLWERLTHARLIVQQPA